MLALCIESSHERGMGHLFRGLILADALHAKGHAVTLLMNDHPASLGIARARGYTPIIVNMQDTASDWETPLIEQHAITLWINDRLETNVAHAARVKASGISLVTFDDPGTGAAVADLHIAALNATGTNPVGNQILQGIDYLILNPNIARLQRLRTRVDSILVTLGGSDTYGVTVTVVKQLAALGKSATIVIGPAFAHQQILQAELTPNFTLKRTVPSMIEEMSHHDLAITGGGITPFEANASGLPCIIIANEPFEMPNAKLLEAMGSSVFAGHHTQLDATVFSRALPIETMSQAGISSLSLDGCNRIIEALEAML